MFDAHLSIVPACHRPYLIRATAVSRSRTSGGPLRRLASAVVRSGGHLWREGPATSFYGLAASASTAAGCAAEQLLQRSATAHLLRRAAAAAYLLRWAAIAASFGGHLLQPTLADRLGGIFGGKL